MGKIISILPKSIKNTLKSIKSAAIKIFYYGKDKNCPVCGKSSRRFRRFGAPARKEAQCVHCNALERHRLLWCFLTKKTDLFDKSKKIMLHVAPELCFESLLRNMLNDGYLTADLNNPRAVVKMDITNIEFPDQSIDVIYCSHVLEHVQDDRKAISEFYPLLKNNGWAILLVPITADKTFEDPSIVEPEDRLRAFGQEDHVRSMVLTILTGFAMRALGLIL